MSKEFSEQQISAGGRWLCDQSADACGVNREDNWKVYGNEYIEEFRGAYNAAVGVSPAIANKATEEGELLNALEKIAAIEDKSFGGDWDEIEEAREIARQAIAADRASRQVANKAEVDLSSLQRYRDLGGFGVTEWETGAYVKLADVENLLATPPATIGASTAPVDGHRLYAAWHKIGADVAGLKFADFMAALGPVGASTVLTNERKAFESWKAKRFEAATYAGEYRYREFGVTDQFRAFKGGLEVAAQAGQVAEKDRLLKALERAAIAESALRRLADEVENDSVPGWEDRLMACIAEANSILNGSGAGQVAVPETEGNLDLSGITSVVLQDRGSKSVIVRFGQSMATATKFLDQFGTLVLNDRAAPSPAKESK